MGRCLQHLLIFMRTGARGILQLKLQAPGAASRSRAGLLLLDRRGATGMKKGDILEGTVARVDFPDRGIVRIPEGTVVVKNTFPGQKIRFMISRKRSGRVEGRLLEVLQPSSLSSCEPLCENFPACGGCTWQTMAYPDQLTLKEAQVRRLIEPVLTVPEQAGWASVYEGILQSPQQIQYRNKMEFTFGDAEKDGPLTLGLHARGSRYDVLTASDCALVHPDMTAVLCCTLDFFAKRGIPYYHRMTHEGILRHLLLRRSASSGELLICLVTASDKSEVQQGADADSGGTFDALLLDYRDALLALNLEGSISGILHMRNDSVADVVRSEKTTILYGQDFFYESLLGLRFLITPFSFFQTNTAGAEVLYSTAREFIGDTKAEVLFDLYSGTGTIAQVLAPAAKQVIGVEIVKEAVEAARINASLNGLDNCSFLAGDVLQVLDEIGQRPDAIVLDPPRDGIHPKALPKIIAYGAPQILYISCKPTSLARDLGVLLSAGYRAERIRLVDLFPQTANVETVCLLHRAG